MTEAARRRRPTEAAARGRRPAGCGAAAGSADRTPRKRARRATAAQAGPPAGSQEAAAAAAQCTRPARRTDPVLRPGSTFSLPGCQPAAQRAVGTHREWRGTPHMHPRRPGWRVATPRAGCHPAGHTAAAQRHRRGRQLSSRFPPAAPSDPQRLPSAPRRIRSGSTTQTSSQGAPRETQRTVTGRRPCHRWGQRCPSEESATDVRCERHQGNPNRQRRP